MQCTWRNIARRLACHGIAKTSPPERLPGPRYGGSLTNLSKFSRRLFTTAQLSTHSTQPLLPFPLSSFSNSSLPADVEVDSAVDTSTLSALTTAQRGRAACRAINLSMQQGNVADALHILNSLRAAAQTEILSKSSPTEHFRPIASAFSSDISQRLPSHTLLHGLVRQGMTPKAKTLAKQMTESGIRVRSRSLEILYAELSHSSTSNHPAPLPTTPSDSAKVLQLQHAVVRDAGTKFALSLLAVARQSKQRRSHNMFKTLITMCIINGEIIVGSLIFGLLLRDWQARELSHNSAETTPTKPQTKPQTPYPREHMLREMCSFVDHTLTLEVKDEQSHFALEESLQALANLAGMLDRQDIPLKNVTCLLRSLYNCPRVRNTVWIPDKKHGRQVQAYSYFHDVLRRLVYSLPTNDHPSQKKMPRLDIFTYNTLLHYSLMHRRSTPMAEQVLKHMMELRQEPLEPDTTTLNIIARAGTILRDSKIALRALWRVPGSRREKKIRREDPVRSLLDIAERNGEGDNFTLNARISHFIATGRPHVVVAALPNLLPGFSPLRCPHGPKATTDAQRAVLCTKCREERVARAVSYGPVILTSILNALQKNGNTGLAEKVWAWAKEAEEQSWTPGPDGIVSPWCLPVHAYTIMIKVYAAEAKKGQYYGCRRPIRVSHRLINAVHWGGGHIRNGGVESRSALGRQMGLEIYRSMAPAARVVEERIAQLHAHFESHGTQVKILKRQVEVPHPDARFFNAVLDIVGRKPGMTWRRRGRPRSYHRRELRMFRRRFTWAGSVSNTEPDPALMGVVNDMLVHGFPVPVLFQRLLVGKSNSTPAQGLDGVGIVERDTRPFAVGGRKVQVMKQRAGNTQLTVLNTRSLSPGVSERGRRKRQWSSTLLRAAKKRRKGKKRRK